LGRTQVTLRDWLPLPHWAEATQIPKPPTDQLHAANELQDWLDAGLTPVQFTSATGVPSPRTHVTARVCTPVSQAAALQAPKGAVLHENEGVVQAPPEQMPLLQSEATVQREPPPQRGHPLAPPQSTPVSAPFETLSVQVGI
jgi:hypothetical protein